jgi:hypothetical protein
MKYLFILTLFLTSCVIKPVNYDQFLREAEKCCLCHGGINLLNYSNYKYALRCKDGAYLTGSDPIHTKFNCGCKSNKLSYE